MKQNEVNCVIQWPIFTIWLNINSVSPEILTASHTNHSSLCPEVSSREFAMNLTFFLFKLLAQNQWKAIAICQKYR